MDTLRPPKGSSGEPLAEGTGQAVYEPRRHENTGVDEEEALYASELVSIDVALERLRMLGDEIGSVQADVVAKGWKGIRERMALEGDGRRDT